VGAEWWMDGGWIDRKKLLAFCNFANTPKNETRQLTKIMQIKFYSIRIMNSMAQKLL
jgi:hypothetical protein